MTPKRKKAPAGAFLRSSLMHFYSGAPMHFLSGVDTLLGAVAEYGADMVVMGAYGHNRLREFVFGGATRHMLRHMRVPTLMSH